jgi:hypothetical protein
MADFRSWSCHCVCTLKVLRLEKDIAYIIHTSPQHTYIDVNRNPFYILSYVRGSLTNNCRFWIGWLDLLAFLAQLPLIKATKRAHNRWLPKTRSIPSWITSCFSFTVTGFSGGSLRLTNCESETYIRISTHLGLTIRFLLLSDSCGFVDMWGALYDVKPDRACPLQLLLALATPVIFGIESRGTCDHIMTCCLKTGILDREYTASLSAFPR